MKKNRLLIIVSGLIILSILSCNRKLNPVSVTKIKDSSYDDAAFNYVYVEAIKNKLMGNEGEALKYLEQAVRINPGSDAAYYEMAQILSSKGDVKNARLYLKKALDIDDQNIWYLMMMAGFYYQEKNLDSAIYYYQTAVKFFPDNENIELTLGNLYTENKDYEKALSIFDAFDKKYGVNSNSTVSAIKTLMMSGNYDEALKKALVLTKEYPDEVLYNGMLAEIYRSKGENDKAREVYNELLERNPDDPQVQLALCDFLISDKNYRELFALLNNVILNNNIKKDDKISLFARLIDLPDLVRDYQDDLFIALMVFEANYKNDEIVPLLRPELLVKLSKLDDAAARLEEIIKLNPDNYYAWEKLLLVYNQKGDYNKLMVRGEECATRFNRSFLAKVLYANAAMEKGKYDIALEELRKAEILAGSDKEFMTQVLTMRADVYYRMKDYVKAFETFKAAIKANADDLTVINNYAYYLAEQDQDLKEAEKMSKKVVEKEKDNTTYLDTYAWVLYKRGKLKEAARIMEDIIKSGGKPDAVWYEHYGFILKKQGNCTKAVENWKEALKLDGTKTNLTEEIKNCRK